MPDEKQLPPVQPEAGNRIDYSVLQCQQMLPNRMQCPRKANWILGSDTNTAMCNVCYVLNGQSSYQTIERD